MGALTLDSHRYLAIGTGIDPRQQVLYGRQLGPLLVGLSLGVVTSATTGIAPGFTGACMNPARAIGLAIAGWNWHGESWGMLRYRPRAKLTCICCRPLDLVARTGT